MSETKEKLRLDKYLWSIRIFKTRSQAAEACEKSKVKMNGNALKASKTVNLNEEYEIKTEAKKWKIKVTGLIDHRVQFSEAIQFYIDLSEKEENDDPQIQTSAFYTGKRMSKTGRPDKKQRKNREDFMNED